MDSKENARRSEKTADQAQDWRPSHEEISQLAYCYYEGRGCVPGANDEDWYQAEQELRRRRAGAGSAIESKADRTVLGVFPSMDDAQRAFDQLRQEGFSRDEISFIASKAGTTEWIERAGERPSKAVRAETTAADIAGDAGIGAAIGGVGGLLLSFAGLAIPGVGPVIAAGPIIAALGGAGIGAAAGGLIGALVESGIPEDEAGLYAEGIRRGGILITVKAAGDRANRAAEILDKHGAVDIEDRVSDWRNRGWARYEPGAQPLTDAEIRREREYFRAVKRQAREWSESADEAMPASSTQTRGSRIYPRR